MSETELDLPAQEVRRLVRVVIVAGIEKLANDVSADLKPLPLRLVGDADRKRVAGTRQKALEASLPAAEPVRLRGEDRSARHDHRMTRGELGAGGDLEIMLIRPPADAVVRTIEEGLGVDCVAMPHRIPLRTHVAVIKSQRRLPSLARALPTDPGEGAPLSGGLIHDVEIGLDRLAQVLLHPRAENIGAVSRPVRIAHPLGHGKNLVIQPLDRRMPPDDSRAPVILVVRPVGRARDKRRNPPRVIAESEVTVRIEIVESEHVEGRRLGHMETDGCDVAVNRPRAVARRAVHEDALESGESDEILTPELDVEKSAEDPLSPEVKVVENDLARPDVAAVFRTDVPAELVRQPGVQRPCPGLVRIALQFRPDARTEPHVVAVAARPRRAEHAIGNARDVIHDLLADAQVRPGVKSQRGCHDERDDQHLLPDRQEFVDAAHVRTEPLGDRHRPVRIEVLLEKSDDETRKGPARAGQAVDELRLAVRILEAAVETARLVVGEAGAARHLEPLLLARRPELDVVALGGRARRQTSRRIGSNAEITIASGVSSTTISTPVAASRARILRPSRPIIRPFTSSFSIWKTLTEFSIAVSVATRCIVWITIFLAWAFAFSLASSMISLI